MKGIEILAKLVFSFSIIVFNLMKFLVILFIIYYLVVQNAIKTRKKINKELQNFKKMAGDGLV